jgi:hypothetical protein
MSVAGHAHALSMRSWTAHLLSEEGKSKEQRDAAYNEFFQIFPQCGNVWIQYASRAGSDAAMLAVLNRATNANKYCPSLWHRYLTCALKCAASGTDVDVKGIFMQAVECVGSHPSCAELWRLVLDTDLAVDDLLSYMFSCPVPCLAALWDKLEQQRHPSVAATAEGEGVLYHIKAQSEKRWSGKRRFEDVLVTDEYNGRTLHTAGMSTDIDNDIDTDIDIDIVLTPLYVR